MLAEHLAVADDAALVDRLVSHRALWEGSGSSATYAFDLG